jgi:sugar O-acyltransferase (sialic acid O-acetyltransferase NeuD family)
MLTNVTILGKSDATVALVIDLLADLNSNPRLIQVVNNLDIPVEYRFDHPRFNIEIVNEIEDRSSWFALGVTKPNAKRFIVKEFDAKHLKWIILEHPTSHLSSTTNVGSAFTIGPLSVVSAFTNIGDFVTVNRGVTIGHHTTIGDYVTINPGCNIAGNVRIGEGTIIGIGANIIDGVTIGKNCIIGAGSVVTKDIPDGVVAYGSPCKVIRNNEA